MADILVIDDEENLSYSIQLALKRAGHECRIADTGATGLAEAHRRLPDLALVDIHLPDGDGLDIMERMKADGLDIPVIVITSFGTIASAVAAMQKGAVDYIQKPLAMEELVLAVDRCLENRDIRNQLDAYRHSQQRAADDHQIIAECPQMRDVLALADKIAGVPIESNGELPAVLLLGETGTGKEALARYIHDRSASADRPFVHVNCTAIPENLFESELFGHEPGAFTHARAAKKGLFEIAHEGTLFLDEIGDLPLAAQAKLLTAIESGRFRRLGGTTERATRVRVMTATNSDLQARVHEGAFRADLFFRLKVFCVEMPALRHRGADIVLLADHFVERYRRKLHKSALTLTPEARAVIRSYSWPGNVRELANVLQRAILVTESAQLSPSALGIDRSASARSVTGESLFDFTTGGCTIAAVEKRLIDAALQHTAGNISEAARLLGLTRGGLRHRLDKLGLARPKVE